MGSAKAGVAGRLPKQAHLSEIKAEEDSANYQSPAAVAQNSQARVSQSPTGPSEVIGDALWLMSQSPAHKHLFLADIDWLVMPPILTRQFRLFKVGARPYAFISWASLSDEVASRIVGGNPKLSPAEWKSGDQLWLIDVVAPFGGAEGILKELKVKVFADRPLMTLHRDGDKVAAREVGA